MCQCSPRQIKFSDFFVFRNKKNRAAVPGNLTFQCKEAIICVSCHNEPVNWRRIYYHHITHLVIAEWHFQTFHWSFHVQKYRMRGGFYIFTLLMYKKTGQPGPEKLRLNTRRLSFMFHIITSQLTGRAKCYHHITFIFITAWYFQTFSCSTATHRKSCTLTLSPKERPGSFGMENIFSHSVRVILFPE